MSYVLNTRGEEIFDPWATLAGPWPAQEAGWLVPHFAHSGPETVGWLVWFLRSRLLDRHVFNAYINDVEQCLTTALFTACADGGSESPPPLDFCKACLWQVMDASIDLRDPNTN